MYALDLVLFVYKQKTAYDISEGLSDLRHRLRNGRHAHVHKLAASPCRCMPVRPHSLGFPELGLVDTSARFSSRPFFRRLAGALPLTPSSVGSFSLDSTRERVNMPL